MRSQACAQFCGRHHGYPFATWTTTIRPASGKRHCLLGRTCSYPEHRLIRLSRSVTGGDGEAGLPAWRSDLPAWRSDLPSGGDAALDCGGGGVVCARSSTAGSAQPVGLFAWSGSAEPNRHTGAHSQLDVAPPGAESDGDPSHAPEAPMPTGTWASPVAADTQASSAPEWPCASQVGSPRRVPAAHEQAATGQLPRGRWAGAVDQGAEGGSTSKALRLRPPASSVAEEKSSEGPSDVNRHADDCTAAAPAAPAAVPAPAAAATAAAMADDNNGGGGSGACDDNREDGDAVWVAAAESPGSRPVGAAAAATPCQQRGDGVHERQPPLGPRSEATPHRQPAPESMLLQQVQQQQHQHQHQQRQQTKQQQQQGWQQRQQQQQQQEEEEQQQQQGWQQRQQQQQEEEEQQQQQQEQEQQHAPPEYEVALAQAEAAERALLFADADSTRSEGMRTPLAGVKSVAAGTCHASPAGVPLAGVKGVAADAQAMRVGLKCRPQSPVLHAAMPRHKPACRGAQRSVF
eukprot:355377-Chlamydomonas_euryale.AAC.1